MKNGFAVTLFVSISAAFLVSKLMLLPEPLSIKMLFLLVPAFCLFFFLNPLRGFLVFLMVRPLLDPFRSTKLLGVSVLAITGAFIVILVIFLSLTDRRFRFFPPTPIKMMYIFFIFAMIAFMQSPDKFSSFENLLKILSIIGIYILAFNFVHKMSDVRLMLRILVYSSVIPIAVGLSQALNKSGILQGGFSELRIHSMFVLANVFAIYLSVAMSLALYLLFDTNTGRKERFFLSVIFFSGAFCLIKTYTVSAWITFAVGCLIMCLFQKKMLRIVIPMGLAVSLFFSQNLADRIRSVTEAPKYGFNSVTFRQDINRQLLTRALPVHPYMGFGVGSSLRVVSRYTDFGALPHSDLVRIAIETGLIGILIYLSFILAVFLRAVFNFAHKRVSFYDPVFFSIFVMYMILSVGTNTFYHIATSGYMFCCFGAWHKMNLLYKNEAENEGPDL
ncbi:MAG: hypothetical protein PHE18_03715 [Candidatus Omnitrophica bacterium]|nr:hypothetical protein [Candidatus Omnitrophota bacterium]MDD5552965.1 hypothetical protein [Candidatus Omnitrophota bacterium]